MDLTTNDSALCLVGHHSPDTDILTYLLYQRLTGFLGIALCKHADIANTLVKGFAHYTADKG